MTEANQQTEKVKRNKTLDKLDQMLGEGMYLEDIAEELERDFYYIKNLCYQNEWTDRIRLKPKKKKIPSRMPMKIVTNIKREEFTEDCKTMTARMLADKYGCSVNSIYYWCNKWDLKPVRTLEKHIKEINMEYVISCLEEGLTMTEAAALVHVTPRTITLRLREMGLSWEKVVKRDRRPKDQQIQREGKNCRPSAKKHDCVYWDEATRCCDYILQEKKRRPCPAWDCTVYKPGKRRQVSEDWKERAVGNEIYHNVRKQSQKDQRCSETVS